MANVSATIARDGVWMRPHLVSVTIPSTRSAEPGPDRVDLQLSPAALAKAKLGMYRVVNTRAGTGNYHGLSQLGIPLAGKTGSAQAAALKLPRIDGNGKVVYETYQVMVEDAVTGEIRMEDRKRPEMYKPAVGTHEQPSPDAPWYRGSGANQDRISHAWYMGFAPADHPKIAFAVMVQYGGGGGATAGYVAKQLLDECIKHGYLAR
jgi:cell division protein FtsI/penicillin-binding protein 2